MSSQLGQTGGGLAHRGRHNGRCQGRQGYVRADKGAQPLACLARLRQVREPQGGPATSLSSPIETSSRTTSDEPQCGVWYWNTRLARWFFRQSDEPAPDRAPDRDNRSWRNHDLDALAALLKHGLGKDKSARIQMYQAH